ncbi:hypothetical protein R5R35_008051 [Gryllus longicercus]|uniref:Protein TsetseEP domain-containing protein n=1 Tax=Gryllus longicercus TaxID=2509291 RepID=A0AAN9Z6A1_9ORTH
MAARALCFVVALCAVQTSQAGSIFNLTAAVSSLTNVVDMLKLSAETSLNSTLESIDTQVNLVVSHLEANFTSALADASEQIQQLVQEAEDEGIAAGDCNLDAASNLTTINVGLPVSLTHCYTDNLNAFNYYVNNIENDISASYQAIKDAVSASTKCGILDFLPCNTKIFLNATSFEQKEAADVAFQLADSATAGINLVGTITLCDEETTSQAILDVYHVVTGTQSCIEAKKAELAASSTATSS